MISKIYFASCNCSQKVPKLLFASKRSALELFSQDLFTFSLLFALQNLRRTELRLKAVQPQH